GTGRAPPPRAGERLCAVQLPSLHARAPAALERRFAGGPVQRGNAGRPHEQGRRRRRARAPAREPAVAPGPAEPVADLAGGSAVAHRLGWTSRGPAPVRVSASARLG